MDNSWFPWVLASWAGALSMLVVYCLHVRWAKGVVPGLPLLGNALALGRHGAAYINMCRRQYGDHFTLSLAGQRMTFLFEPQHIDYFFKAPDSEVTFRPAVEQFTQRVFGLPSNKFFPLHMRVLTDLRHLLVPSALPGLARQLGWRTGQHLPHLAKHSQVELSGAVRRLVFQSAVEVLFGEALAGGVPGGMDALMTAFFTFEEGFEMAAAPIPHIFQPNFVAARSRLLTWLGTALRSGALEGSPVALLVQGIPGLDPALGPNLLLALLWASQANTVPATFWALAFLLLPAHARHQGEVLRELQEEVAAGEAGPHALSDAAFKLSSSRKSAISRCVAEAIRLRVQSIDVRIAARDLVLPCTGGGQLRLPKGRIMALCPFDSHHATGLYGEDAWAFNPDRAGMQLGDGTAVVPTVAGLAFGGGPYRCPGRFFAELEICLFVQLVLASYDMQLTYARPPDSELAQRKAEAAIPPQPNLKPDHGGSLLYRGLCWLLGGSNITWGLGWFDGLDGQLQTWQFSGDPEGVLPPCNLDRLVGVKVPGRVCWVQVQKRDQSLQ